MIRIATIGDIPAMLEIYAPYVLNTTNSFEYTVPSQEAFTERFLSYTQMFPWLVWEENGTVLGYAYGSLPFSRAGYRWCCEVSIYITPIAQGKGIGRRLYHALETILWNLGYRVIYAIVTSENKASLAFHEKAGYRFCAELPGCGYKLGRSLGITWLEKRSNSVELPTEPPMYWSAFVNNDRKLRNILDILSLS